MSFCLVPWTPSLYWLCCPRLPKKTSSTNLCPSTGFKEGCTELMCAMPVLGANHLLIVIICGGLAGPLIAGALPYFTKSGIYTKISHTAFGQTGGFIILKGVRFHFGNKPGCKLTQSSSSAKNSVKKKWSKCLPRPWCIPALCLFMSPPQLGCSRTWDHRQDCRAASVTVSPHGLSAGAPQRCPKTERREFGTTSSGLCSSGLF